MPTTPSNLDRIRAACSRVHLAANACFGSLHRRDLVTATDESTQALDRLGELRILAREAFLVNKEITSSERRAFADYEEAQAAAMNAAQAVRDAVQGLWQSAHGSAARGAS